MSKHGFMKIDHQLWDAIDDQASTTSWVKGATVFTNDEMQGMHKIRFEIQYRRANRGQDE